MSVRRTRSGTPLGGHIEPRRLRQTPVRRQQSLKAGDEAASNSVTRDTTTNKSPRSNKAENSSGKAGKAVIESNSTKASPDSRKKPAALGANIWERLEKDNWELFKRSKTINVDKGSNGGRVTTAGLVSTDKAVAAETSPSTGNRSTRKPEILVSLLENEGGYSMNHAKSKYVGERKSEEGDNVKCTRDRTFSSLDTANHSINASDCMTSTHLCVFPHCDFHKGVDTTPDFLPMPEVPGEPFFVSLSKDKNKELNMVKTSSGTVRVGCGLRRFLHPGQSFTDSCGRHSLPVQSKSRDGTLQERPPEGKTGDRPGISLFPPDCRISIIRSDKDTDGKSGLGLRSQGQDSEPQCAMWSNLGENDQSSNILGETGDPMASKAAWSCESSSVKFSDISTGHTVSSLEYQTAMHKLNSAAQHDSALAQDNSFSAQSHPKSSTPNTVSQYPLMKEILTEQNYPSFSAAPLATVCIHQPAVLHGETGVIQSKKTVSLLKPSAASLTSLPSLLTVDSEYETKTVVKRSERIRCKNGMGALPAVSHSQSVISTMKPSDKKSKSKSKSSKKKSRPPHSKDVQKKKSKKSKSDPKKTNSVVKRSKDFSKAKATMSREVMDAIVQSIEETVSRGSHDMEDEEVQESTSRDTSCSTSDLSSLQADTYNFTATSEIPGLMDHWSDGSTVQDEENSGSAAELSLTLLSGSVNNSLPTTSDTDADTDLKSKKSKPKSKKSNKKNCHRSTSNVSKSSKLKIYKAKEPSLSIRTMIDSSHTPVTGITLSSEDSARQDVAIAIPHRTESTPDGTGTGASKRFRKKTRKAEEAFGDYDVFCDEELPIKKSKSKKRSSSSSSSCDSAVTSGQRRSRRSSQMGGLMADPVLEEHAFILWASENRSQLEQQHPGASTCEVDAILSSRWCDVTDSVKARFFFRAREAFSDDDRHMIRSSAMADLESGALGDFFTDRDPVFTEFIRLSIDRQRELLRKWLKFFQKMLPKKEYIEFIVTFKRACGREVHSPTGRPKRARMRCLDPAYYKMLFDMIRLTKPRVLEVYRERRGKERKVVADTYSLMLHKLISEEPWPHMVVGCRSQALTEILDSLGLPDVVENAAVVASGTASILPSDGVSVSGDGALGTPVVEDDNDGDAAGSDEEAIALAVDRQADWCGTGSRDELSLEECDYSVLNTDLAHTLLTGLSQIAELPNLDQEVLDQVFLAPPRLSATPTSQRRTISLYRGRMETPPTYQSVSGSPCQPRLLPTDTLTYPKMSVHFPPMNAPRSSGMLVHHIPSSTAPSPAHLPQKHSQRDGRDASPVRTVCCRKDSPMDMHSYSITMENVLRCPAHLEGAHNKCIKVHSKSITPQSKLSLQPVQLPVNSRPHPPTSKLHPRVVPVSCGYQQRFSGQMFPPTSVAMRDKVGSHHIYHMGAPLPSTSPSTPSRIYSHPLGMSSPSPLITSLSPLRSIKYTHSSKIYNTAHCQMMPYKPRMQPATASSGHGYRRTAHTIPISTTLKTGSPRGQGNLQQIKVCLPTQALKIPIAKLRGSRRTSYLRGKVKNLSLQSALEPLASLPCTQPCPYSARTSPPSSVLAKVLSYQAANDNTDQYTRSPVVSEAISTIPASNTKPVTSAFISTMRPISIQPIPSALKSTTQLQIVTMVSNNSAHSPELQTGLTTQTAVVVSPLTWRKRAPFVQSAGSVSTVQTASGMSSSGWTDTANTSTTSSTLSHLSSSRSLHHLSTTTSSVMPAISEYDPTESPSLNLRESSSDMDNTAADFIVVGTCTANRSPRDTGSLSEDYLREDDRNMSSLVSDDSAISSWSCSDTQDEENVSDPVDDLSSGTSAKSEETVTMDNSKIPSASESETKSWSSLGQQEAAGNTSQNTQLVGRDAHEVKSSLVMGVGVTSTTSPAETTLSSSSSGSTSTASTISYCLSGLLMRGVSDIDSDNNVWQCRCPACVASRARILKDRHLRASVFSSISSELLTKDDQSFTLSDSSENFNTGHINQQHTILENTEISPETPANIASPHPDTAISRTASPIYERFSMVSNTNSSIDSTTDCQTHSPIDPEDTNSCANKDEKPAKIVSKALPLPASHCKNDVLETRCLSVDLITSSITKPSTTGCDQKSTQAQSSLLTSNMSSFQKVTTEMPSTARSLLTSRNVERSSVQLKSMSEDGMGVSKKSDGSVVSETTTGPVVKKMTMCSVTVQPDTGCILVESLAMRDKGTTHVKGPTSELLTSPSAVGVSQATPISLPVSVSQTVCGPTSSLVIGQSVTSQRPVRTSVVTCGHVPFSVSDSLSNVTQAPPTMAQSPTGSRKRAHYVHEYLPT